MEKAKKIIIGTIAILFIAGTGYGLVVMGLIFSSTKDEPDASPDTIIILGAQVKGKNKAEAYPSRSLAERLDRALEYLEQRPDMTVVVSGGQGADEPDAEANVMANYLIQHGIRDDKIIRETKSTSTLENLRFSNELCSLQNAIVVTNDYHMYRTKMFGKRLGLNLQGLSATTNNSSKYYSYLRETLALGYDLSTLVTFPSSVFNLLSNYLHLR